MAERQLGSGQESGGMAGMGGMAHDTQRGQESGGMGGMGGMAHDAQRGQESGGMAGMGGMAHDTQRGQESGGMAGMGGMAHDAQRGQEMGSMPQMEGMAGMAHSKEAAWLAGAVILLGLWLMGSPWALGYAQPATFPGGVARITELRGLASPETRGDWMAYSDFASGLALTVLGLAWLYRSKVLAPWIAALVGLWLLFAPLVLWSPSPAAFLNGQLVGALVLAFTILIGSMPGMMKIMQPGPEVPPGWSYNPSSWPQRVVVIALAFVGFALSRYLAAYQFGYANEVWEPFFGDGTKRILDSDVSVWWPVSDAGLGMLSYELELLMGFMGGTSRWRTMPWMVAMFAVLVIPLGVTSITLIILQPVMVGTWCTICLVTAAGMLAMIPLTIDEVWGMGQYVLERRRRGESLLRVFVLGGSADGDERDVRSPGIGESPRRSFPAMAWGVTVPPGLAVAAVAGLWLLASPQILGTGGPLSDNNNIAGALVATVAVIAMAEVVRPLRLLNLGVAAWILVAPLLLDGANGATWISSIVVALAVAAPSLPRGPIRERYGQRARLAHA